MRSTITGLVAVAGTLLGGLWPASGTPQTPTPAGFEQWLSGREALQIELNNTLVEARRLAAPSVQATTTCHKLAGVSQQLLRGGHAPHPHLDTAANAGITQFTQAAQACLAGDFSLMRRQIDEGTTLRADAQDTIDGIMHAEHAVSAQPMSAQPVANLASATGLRVASSPVANKSQLTLTSALPSPQDPVVVAVGDIACTQSDPDFNAGLGTPGHCHMKATSDLAVNIAPASVFMLGDPQYNSGALPDFNASYDPSWGRLKSITRPAVGNHEYGTNGAGGYFTYFGNAGTPQQPGCVKNCDGWYSFDVGQWHIVVLNSECTKISGGTGCAVGSPQQQWLAADLKVHPAACTAVLQHRPRWSSNSFASVDAAPLLDTMHAAGVDLLLTGHAHSYERFAPQSPSGARDDAAGIREMVVGTGGAFYTGFSTIMPNSLVRGSGIFGVLKLTLHPTSYDWTFVADPTTPFTDSGTGTCH
jgi:hypothetical protein